MLIVYAILLILLNFFWLLTNLAGLPGNWLMVITTAIVVLVQWRAPGEMFSVATLVSIAVLATLGEVLELVAGAAGARQAGATRRGSIGALAGGLVGGIAGTFLIPIPAVGSVLGACAGAFIGALYMEFSGGRKLDEAVRSGWGAGKGRLVGTLVKVAIGAIMWLTIAIAAFWP
jgi:uncharacterized protein YqgC (DUF456 family)